MEQEVYADILFLINFSMDFLTLYLCARLLHLPQRTVRMLIAAAVGGVYGVASLFFAVGAVRSLVLNVAVASLMCAVAFAPRRASHLCKATALFYGIGFLVGGSMTAIYHLCNRYLLADRVYQNGNYQTIQGDTSLPLFAVLAAASALIATMVGRLFFAKSKQRTAQLSLCFADKTLCVQALCDSGNLLCDPISGHPVLFLQYIRARQWLPPMLTAFFAAPTPEALVALPQEYAKRIRLLSVTTVQGKGTLYCLRPDSVQIDGTETEALVGIVDSATRDFGDFFALVPEQHFGF